MSCQLFETASLLFPSLGCLQPCQAEGGLGCESIADWRGFFSDVQSASDFYVTGMQTDVLQGTTQEKDRIQLSRLRVS